MALPPPYLRLLGLVPLAIGVVKFPALFRSYSTNVREQDRVTTRGRHMWGVAALTVAGGGDNIGLYLPLFATHSSRERLVIMVVFLVMTGAWCLLASWLTYHRVLQSHLQRWGSRLLPIVLIALGIRILFPGH